MAFLGFHSSSVLLYAYRNGWHPSEDVRKPCAKFVDPCGMTSFDVSDIGFIK
jgi:hypothetical protein